MSRNNFTAPPSILALPPLPPVNNTIVASGTAQADSPNLASVGNAQVESLADKFFDLRSHDGGDVDDDFFQEEGAPDESEASPLAGRSLFSVDPLGAVQIAGGDKDEGAPSSANFGDFPSAIPTLQNWFANQDTTLNDEGYDSEGNLPYFADEEQDDIEGYEELPMWGDAAAPAPPPPPAPAVAPTVKSMMCLGVKELKAELQLRGRSTGGGKADLQARLTEAIENNAPIASGREAPRHENMNGLDVTARWEVLTRNEHPVPEPENEDSTNRPPTERDATINPKYGCEETFVRVPFSGTTEKMLYVRPNSRSVNRKKTARKRKLSQSRHSRPTMPVRPNNVGIRCINGEFICVLQAVL